MPGVTGLSSEIFTGLGQSVGSVPSKLSMWGWRQMNLKPRSTFLPSLLVLYLSPCPAPPPSTNPCVILGENFHPTRCLYVPDFSPVTKLALEIPKQLNFVHQEVWFAG